MKLSILSVLSFAPLFAMCQSWCPPGTNWSFETSSVGGGGFTHYQYEKDTVVNGTSCKKLLGYTEDDSSVPGPPYEIFTYESNDTVYFFNDGSFKPTYYFDAVVGDTVGVPIPTQPCGVLKAVVDSVGTVLIQGQSLRYYRAAFDDDGAGGSPPSYMHVVERLGALNQHIIPYPFCDGFTSTYEYALNCYQDNTISRHQLVPGTACRYYFPVGIAENDAINTQMTLSPNPASTSITISTAGSSIRQYEVINAAGTQFIATTADGKDVTIDVSILPAGIYLVKLKVVDGQYALKRFVKQ